MTAPRLSLCMIVRDEEELLPEFLESVSGLWDELCVVDTGSRDATVRILEEAGARVEHRPWRNDFAAARNESLGMAKGDFILVLDADERVRPALRDEIRATIAENDVGAATIGMRNALPHGQERRTDLLRLFRRDPEIRFRHRIHEEVATDVRAYLSREGKRLVHLRGDALHLGYVRERAAAKNKKARDKDLLLAAIKEAPNDFYSWYKLLELGRFWQDRELLRQAATACEPALQRFGERELGTALYAGDLVVWMAEALHESAPAAALRLIEQWVDKVPASVALFLRRGELHERLGDRAKAEADFRRCLELAESSSDPRLTSVRPRMALSRLALSAGDFTTAASLTLEALHASPRDPEALLSALVISRARGGEAEIHAFAAAHRQKFGSASELDDALADEAILSGHPEEAVRHLSTLAGTPPNGRFALRLGHALLQAGAVDEAAALARTLYPTDPAAGLGILICDLVRDRDTNLELDMEAAEASRALRPWTDAVLASGRADMIERLRENAPAVAGAFPWLPNYVAAAAPALNAPLPSSSPIPARPRAGY